MARTSVQTLLISLAIGAACAAPAAAQFNSIFGNPPPRPPGSVPGGTLEQPLPPPQFPSQQQQLPQRQQQPLQPAPTSLPQPQRAPGGGIQSEPLAPPPGATAAPPQAGLPPQLRRGTPAPADTSPQPGDEVISEPPAVKIVNQKAVFAGLDKITGRIIAFDASIGETVQFGALQVTPRTCFTRPPTENQNTDGFVEVDEVTLTGDVRRIFNGWMFTASPGLHAVEHPVYDVWLTDCKSPAVTAAAPEPAPAPAARPPAPRPPAAPRAQAPAPTPRPPAPR